MGHNRTRCPCCNSILDGSGFREGIRLPRTRLKLFDLIKSAGSSGISSLAICERTGLNPRNVISQIYLLREHLENTDLRIVCIGRGIEAKYSMKRIPKHSHMTVHSSVN